MNFGQQFEKRRGSMSRGMVLFLGSLIVIAILGYLAMAPSKVRDQQTNSDSTSDSSSTSDEGKETDTDKAPTDSNAKDLMLYCAAGIKLPVAEAIQSIQDELGIEVEVQYGGTGTLLNNLRTSKTGDLYLAADTSFIELANSYDLLDETLPVAKIHPVIAVAKGNPKNIKTLDDLLKEDIKFALANEGASIGKLSKKIFEEKGKWDEYKKKTHVFKPTVNDIALDVQLGTVDAAIVWDSNAKQNKEIDFVSVPEMDKEVQEITIAVLKTCEKPATALKVCRYLQAPEKGQKSFDKFHYGTVQGDHWEEFPKILFFSGGVNRVAIQDTIADFQKREGVEIDTVYNGCGILVSMMNTGSQPDAYFACDVSYMVQVQDRFTPSVNLAETAMVIITPKGNPNKIENIEDLGRENLKVGLAHEVKSALGKLTKDLLIELDLYDKVKPNVVVDSPTADFLVNQLRTGSIDASIVYAANVAKEEVNADIEIIPIKVGRAKAIQPIAISKETKYPYLVKRMVLNLVAPDSKKQFEKVKFKWLYGGELE